MSTAPTTIDAFEASLSASEPPVGCAAPLAALWWAQRGNWDTAHALVQDDVGADAAWVHAWLHRVEGDNGNAAYWYRRAGRPVAQGRLSDEWSIIATEFLERAGR